LADPGRLQLRDRALLRQGEIKEERSLGELLSKPPGSKFAERQARDSSAEGIRLATGPERSQNNFVMQIRNDLGRHSDMFQSHYFFFLFVAHRTFVLFEQIENCHAAAYAIALLVSFDFSEMLLHPPKI
jgi:hypothetical protein